MTQENNSLKLRIYAFNQKGRSASYSLPDFSIGSTAFRTGKFRKYLSMIWKSALVQVEVNMF